MRVFSWFKTHRRKLILSIYPLYLFRLWYNTNKIAKRVFRDRSLPLILVYQMGKVGSTSVYMSLLDSNIKNPVLHLHFLSAQLIDHSITHKKADVKYKPYHIALGQATRKYLMRNIGFPIRVITLVRDPIAWFVSILFEPPYFEKEILDESSQIDPERVIKYAQSKIEDLSTFDYMLKWFEKELKSVFHIDVFSYPFEKRKGYSRYAEGNTEVLLITLESLSLHGEEQIKNFLDYEDFKLKRYYSKTETPEGQKYKYVVENLKLTIQQCKNVYNSKFVQHFYTQQQILQFIQRWT